MRKFLLYDDGSPKVESQTGATKKFPAWAKVPIRYFAIFHDRVLGLRPHFRKLENFWNGGIYMFRPMRNSGFSRYRVTVIYPGVLFKITRSLVSHAIQLRVPFC